MNRLPGPGDPEPAGAGAVAACALLATEAKAGVGRMPPKFTVYEKFTTRGVKGVAAVRKTPALESASGWAFVSVAKLPPYVLNILFSKSVRRPGPNACEMPAAKVAYDPRFCWLFAPVYCALTSSSVPLRGKTPSNVTPARCTGRPGSWRPTIVVDGPSASRGPAAVSSATLSV